ncbi:MAG: cytochrome c [Betaproteobacteria bacterium]|nr:MAG: cytochrome c [Betaproteobacteria bacterium]
MKVSITVLVMLFAMMPCSATAEISPGEARDLFDQMCAGCHGFRGDGGEGHRGGFSPHVGTLADKEYMAQVPDEYIYLIIAKGGAFMGKIATMPAWEKRLSEEQMRGLVTHIRTFTQ